MTINVSGKTKEFTLNPDGKTAKLTFKDNVTGREDNGKIVEDGGGDQVVGTRPEVGMMACETSEFFFKLLEKNGIPTHFIARVRPNEMLVKAVAILGKGLELIKRFRSVGSYCRSFGMYKAAAKGAIIDKVQICVKNDAEGDPIIDFDDMLLFGIIKSKAEYDRIILLLNDACKVIADFFADNGAELYDIKLEFGWWTDEDGTVYLIVIDEISAGNFRVYKDGKEMTKEEVYHMVMKSNVAA